MQELADTQAAAIPDLGDVVLRLCKLSDLLLQRQHNTVQFSFQSLSRPVVQAGEVHVSRLIPRWMLRSMELRRQRGRTQVATVLTE
eukprot:15303421-Heterocapsa_arctica.AAC.1